MLARQGLFRRAAAALTASVCACVGGCTVAGDPGTGVPVDPQQGQGAAPTEQTLHSILVGEFAPLTGFDGISGRAQLVRGLGDETRVNAVLFGLPGSATLPAHVHNGPCAVGGGGHYKIDPGLIDPRAENELWLQISTTPEGVGTAEARLAHRARGDALSIVVHDPASGAKMACADLGDGVEDIEVEGEVWPFAAAEEIDKSIGGWAGGWRWEGGTSFELDLAGLDPAAQYAAHVHALPCGVSAGGGHYRFDPTVPDGLESNELWFSVEVDEDGNAYSWLDSAHAIRADAQSIVVHRIVAPDQKPRVACADLERTTSFPDMGYVGELNALPDATARGYDIGGTASVVRELPDVTEVSLSVYGLEHGVEYTAHVHDRPCAVQSGGAHYQIDRASGETGEANEMWLRLSSCDDGVAEAEAWFPGVARSDALSIVIHDPADNARLACVDL